MGVPACKVLQHIHMVIYFNTYVCVLEREVRSWTIHSLTWSCADWHSERDRSWPPACTCWSQGQASERQCAASYHTYMYSRVMMYSQQGWSPSNPSLWQSRATTSWVIWSLEISKSVILKKCSISMKSKSLVLYIVKHFTLHCRSKSIDASCLLNMSCSIMVFLN